MKVHPTTSTAGFVRPRVRSWLGAATALARLALAAALGGLVVMTASLISPHDATGAVPDCATAPNARTWISGPPPASWNNNLRWSNNGSQPPLPGPDEIACIGDEPVELNVPAEVDAVVSGPNGTLAMPTGQVLTLSPQNGEVSQVANIGERPALAGTGDMIVTKSFIADGPGYKIAGPAGSTLTLAPSVGTNARIGLAHLDGRSLVVSDGVTMTSSSTFGFLGLFSIESSNGGSIVNSGVWNAPADGSILRASSASVFRNTATGILKKTGGSSVTAVLAERIVNDGLIDNQTSGVLGLGTEGDPGGPVRGKVHISTTSPRTILTGSGRLAPGVFQSSAIVAPGASAGTIQVTGAPGSWELGQSGDNTPTLEIEIGGTGAGQFDQLALDGAFTLPARFTRLALSTLPGYTPVVGHQFAIVTASSVTGTFETMTGTDLGGGRSFQVVYEANRVLVRVIGPPGAASADLSLVKSDSPDPVTVGSALTYTLAVSNAGPDAATGVRVSDTLPGGVTFDSATPSQGTCSQAAGTVACDLGPIASGQGATVAIQVTPNSLGTISNTASVSSSTADPDGANNSDSEDTLVHAPTATITVVKDLIPSTDPGRFTLLLDHVLATGDVRLGVRDGAGDGATLGPRTVAAAPGQNRYRISELDEGATDLADYERSILCVETGGDSPPASSPSESLELTVAPGDEWTCTITNQRRSAEITVVKDLIPSSDPGRFDLTVAQVLAGSDPLVIARLDDAGDGGTLGPLAVSAGPGANQYLLNESGGGRAGDYAASLRCEEDAAGGTNPASPDSDGQLTVAPGDDWTCTFTNTRLIDTSPPVVTVPGNLIVDATSPAGATVGYTASANDAVDPSPSLTCTPMSGSTFPIGTTTVTCTATDAAGNSSSATFKITVRGAGEQIVVLIDKTLAFLDLPALRPLLKARLTAAATALVANNKRAACTALNVYNALVQAAPGSALTPLEKSKLIADANRIRAVIGC